MNLGDIVPLWEGKPIKMVKSSTDITYFMIRAGWRSVQLYRYSARGFLCDSGIRQLLYLNYGSSNQKLHMK